MRPFGASSCGTHRASCSGSRLDHVPGQRTTSPRKRMLEPRVTRTGALRGTAALVSALIASLAAHAQPYPNHPIKIVVPYPAGGAVDIVARTIGQPLAEALAQPVIVDNRPGASANIGMEAVAKAAPDGYTLLMASNGI